MELVFSLRVLQNVIDMKESVVNKVRMFPSIKYFKTSDWSKWDTCSSWNFLVVAPTWKRQLKKREVGKYRLKLVSFQNCKQVIKNFQFRLHSNFPTSRFLTSFRTSRFFQLLFPTTCIQSKCLPLISRSVLVKSSI